MEYRILDTGFYRRDAVTVARDLLGKYLVHETDGQRLVAEITETEAYTGVNDRACHSYGGRRTARTEVMYRSGGISYIYLIYGMYYLFNAVTGAEGDPCAVLIRSGLAVEGRDGIALRRTGRIYEELTPKQRAALLDGPGKFCGGLGLAKEQNARDLTAGTLYLCEGERRGFAVEVGARIGVAYAGEDALLPYRFSIASKDLFLTPYN